jgi:hypothetical protein
VDPEYVIGVWGREFRDSLPGKMICSSHIQLFFFRPLKDLARATIKTELLYNEVFHFKPLDVWPHVLQAQ